MGIAFSPMEIYRNFYAPDVKWEKGRPSGFSIKGFAISWFSYLTFRDYQAWTRGMTHGLISGAFEGRSVRVTVYQGGARALVSHEQNERVIYHLSSMVINLSLSLTAAVLACRLHQSGWGRTAKFLGFQATVWTVRELLFDGRVALTQIHRLGYFPLALITLIAQFALAVICVPGATSAFSELNFSHLTTT